jgi:demethylmenaquinone methyltransferase/2-methoxy-6-polyprenyl-1,4-benzoquinol methylase
VTTRTNVSADTLIAGIDREIRASFVRDLFGSIATRYDLLNRLISIGQDQSWRREAVRLCQLPRTGKLLDTATGTGDMALLARREYPDSTVIGLDLTLPMLQQAREKSRSEDAGPYPLLGGDALDLPFPDDYFDAVISGFMVRNVADVHRAFAEQRRVVRSGGRVVCLEITIPTDWPANWIFWAYFYGFVPLMGAIVSGQPAAYRYLPRSVAQFLTAQQVQSAMEQVGLRQVSHQLLRMHSVALHVGVK